MTTYDYPGVVVKEDATPILNIMESETAVPVMRGTFYLRPQSGATKITQLDKSTSPIKITSLDAFNKQFCAYKTVLDNTAKADNVLSDISKAYYAVRHYFHNGGGHCYIAAPSAQAPADATLQVYCDDTPPANEEWLVDHATLFTIVGTGVTVTDGALGIVATIASPADQTAVYGPYWQTTYQPVLDDFVVSTDKSSAPPSALFKDPKLTKGLVLSPAAAVAGIYCTTDRTRGVWKAPANASVVNVQGFVTGNGNTPLLLTPDVLSGLIGKNVNGFRKNQAGELLVWGAHTNLSTDSPDFERWKYVPVRRTFNAVEHDVRKAMNNVLFEPNTAVTWQLVDSAIESYLNRFWREGGLVGNKPEEAYSVSVGAGDQLSEMKVTVQLAAVKPAEFITLEFSQIQA